MKKVLSLTLVIILCLGLFPFQASADEAVGDFLDVMTESWFAPYVQWAVRNAITTGTSKTTFSPNDTCTVAQILTLLWRERGSEKTGISNPFSDVKSDAYYYDAVVWAVANGVTQGTSETTFNPNKTCTRGQIVTFLYRDLAD